MIKNKSKLDKSKQAKTKQKINGQLKTTQPSNRKQNKYKAIQNS